MFVKELGCHVKSTQLEFKDIDSKQGIVVGYFAAFGNKDSDGDIIMPGAFTKSIREQGPTSAKPRIKHLLDHNRQNGVAKILALEEDAIGLRYESKAGRHTNGQDWLYMCEDGIITEHSIGFEPVKQQAKADANYMTETILWEGSGLQTWGANANTPVEGFKSMTKAIQVNELVDRFDKLEKAMRNGKYSDGTFINIEKELRAIKHLLSLTIDTTEPEPSEVTIQPDTKDAEIINAIKNFTLTAFN